MMISPATGGGVEVGVRVAVGGVVVKVGVGDGPGLGDVGVKVGAGERLVNRALINLYYQAAMISP